MLYWRPGCVFCSTLRHDLRRLGLSVREVNIWTHPAAAAIVRALAHGSATVPTVVIGDIGLVNPTAGRVLEAVRGRAPVSFDRVTVSVAARSGRGPGWVGALAAAAWPVALRTRRGRRLAPRAAITAALGGAVFALITTGLLAAAHALRGPTVTGSGRAPLEALIATFVGGAVGVALTAWRPSTPRTIDSPAQTEDHDD